MMDSSQFEPCTNVQIEKVLSRMEKELEWESSNVAIKTKLIKQQNQRSGCLLLTLKQKDQAIL